MHVILNKTFFFVLLVALLGTACRSPDTVPATGSGQDGVETRERMRHEVSGQRLRYLVQHPSGARPEKGWPLLLFLHGYGECGDDLDRVKKHGPPKRIGSIAALQQCVLVSPQCPSDSWWRVEALYTLVREVMEMRGDIDVDRRYVTGLSMGGYGTWSLISSDPAFFAAAVPICGGGNPFRLPANRPPVKTGIVNQFDPEGLLRASKLPVWAFHGSEDSSVPILETERMLDLLQKGGNRNARFTAYEGVGHVGAWQRAYGDPALWQWLFTQ
ncbi:MAG: phospholipase [Verrucomicrobiota bacterium]|nr:phospholipase [Verrucomicrobiota bacterium]